MSEERFANAAALPQRLHRLHELAIDLWWSWDDRARMVFRQLDYTLWRATAHNPVQMLQRITAERLQAAVADPEFVKAYDEAIFGFDQARTQAHPWWARAPVDARQRQHRLLLRGVRAPPVAADLCGRPRRARRRSLQGSGGPRPAVRRHRLHVSAGLLPPAHDQRRLAGRTLRAHQLDRRADRNRDHARWPPVRGRRAARRPHRAGRGVARAPRPRQAAAARHRSRGERAVGSRVVGAALRRRSRNPHPAGNHPRHRRRAGAAPDGHRADRVPPQRRPRGVRRAAAHPRNDRAGPFVRRCARRSQALDGLHHAHPGPRRTRRVSISARRKAPVRNLGRLRAASPELPRARRIRQRQRLAVQHDRAGAAHLVVRQRRQRAARRSDAVDVAADVARHAVGSIAGAQHHQRRPRADLDGRSGVRAARPSFRSRLAGSG